MIQLFCHLSGQCSLLFSPLLQSLSWLYLYSYGDIVVYQYTTSFMTLEEVKNYKSLQSYKYFTAGWVIECKWKVFPECCVVIGKVNHNYALSASHLQPWVVINNSGVVICGHCICMAGLGETCSHVGALLYLLEYRI